MMVVMEIFNSMCLKHLKNNNRVLFLFLLTLANGCGKKEITLSEREMVCIYFFYQQSFFNTVTEHCNLISDSLIFYDVVVDKQYCEKDKYVVHISSQYYKDKFDNGCGYSDKIIFENCSDTIIDGYYGGTSYSDLYNKIKIQQNRLKYSYLDSIQYESIQIEPYPFQMDSYKFISYCKKNKAALSPVLTYILKHKGYL